VIVIGGIPGGARDSGHLIHGTVPVPGGAPLGVAGEVVLLNGGAAVVSAKDVVTIDTGGDEFVIIGLLAAPVVTYEYNPLGYTLRHPGLPFANAAKAKARARL
jgi:hypothetical protein